MLSNDMNIELHSLDILHTKRPSIHVKRNKSFKALLTICRQCIFIRTYVALSCLKLKIKTSRDIYQTIMSFPRRLSFSHFIFTFCFKTLSTYISNVMRYALTTVANAHFAFNNNLCKSFTIVDQLSELYES